MYEIDPSRTDLIEEFDNNPGGPYSSELALVVNRLRLAYGRKPGGLNFNAIDGEPVYNFFLIIAPPLEVSNQYLPVLGKIAQFAKDAAVPGDLLELSEPEEFLALLAEKAS